MSAQEVELWGSYGCKMVPCTGGSGRLSQEHEQESPDHTWRGN